MTVTGYTVAELGIINLHPPLLFHTTFRPNENMSVSGERRIPADFVMVRFLHRFPIQSDQKNPLIGTANVSATFNIHFARATTIFPLA